MQAEPGTLIEHLLDADVLLGAGEFNGVEEGLTQAFDAVESEDVDRSLEVVDFEGVAAVVVKYTRTAGHNSYFPGLV